jgi:hypothetical protein
MLATLSLLWLLLAAQACKDTCSGVDCGPAPPLIVATVTDTLSVDTTLTLTTSKVDSFVTVDTTLIVRRQVTDAAVFVAQIAGADTVAFDTLQLRDGLFYKDDPARMPTGSFVLAARRGSRIALVQNLTVQQVDGCCSYPVVGRYTLTLP